MSEPLMVGGVRILNFGEAPPPLPKDVLIHNADVLKPKANKFQVMEGSDWHSRPILTDDGKGFVLEPALDDVNRPIVKDGKTVMRIKVKDVGYGPKFPGDPNRNIAGDIVESNLDLTKKNSRLSKRYKKLGEEGEQWPAELQQERLKAQEADRRYRRALDRMTARELVDHANEEGIDVGGETKKEALIKLILAATEKLVAAA